MAVVSTPNASSIKVKFDHGTDLNGDRVIKTKTYSSIKSGATNDNVICPIRLTTTYTMWYKQTR